ncbi:MAG: hypothetical protein ACP5OK_05535 [Thermoprotei archaeon]
MKRQNSAKLLMYIEALFGGFYVAVTRGLFIPMLTYQNYPVNLLSYVSLIAALLSILISYLIYAKPNVFTGNVKTKLLIVHATERFFWMSLPFMISSPEILSIMYALAQAITIPVGILLNLALFLSFKDDELIDVNVVRSSIGSASSILGSLFIIYTTATVKPPESYYIAYIYGSLTGLIASISLLFYPSNMLHSDSQQQFKKKTEEIEVRRVNIFILLTLALAGANLIGLGWSPLLKGMNAPLYLVTALSLAGSLGGIIGPYLWKGLKSYTYAMILNTLFTLLLFFTPWPLVHLGYSAILSMTFVGFNFIALSIYSKYIRSLGIVEASVLLTASNSVGLLMASITGLYINNLLFLFLLASIFKLSALIISLLAIPESAIVPVETAYGYSRLIYSIGVMGYTFTMETSKRTIKLFIQSLALAILITLLYFIYRVAIIIGLGG